MPTSPATPVVSAASSAAPNHQQPIRFLRFPAVLARTALSRSIWRLERRGEFPRHRRISRNAVAWIEAEVADWMGSRATSAPDGGTGRP